MLVYESRSTMEALYAALPKTEIVTFLTSYDEADYNAMVNVVNAWVSGLAPKQCLNATSLSDFSVQIADTDGLVVYYSGMSNFFEKIGRYGSDGTLQLFENAGKPKTNVGCRSQTYQAVLNGTAFMTKVSSLTYRKSLFYAVRQGSEAMPLGVVQLRLENPNSLI